jgi:hypothetical protein
MARFRMKAEQEPIDDKITIPMPHSLAERIRALKPYGKHMEWVREVLAENLPKIEAKLAGKLPKAG